MAAYGYCRKFNTTRQAGSRHLCSLTECEPVKQEQQGRAIYYSLEIDKLKKQTNGWNNTQKPDLANMTSY